MISSQALKLTSGSLVSSIGSNWGDENIQMVHCSVAHDRSQGKGSTLLNQTVRTHHSIAELDDYSAQTRELILRSVFRAGAGHIGGPLSVTDMLVNLYFDRLRIDPQNPHDPQRDRLILSKGHSSIALYTVLALRGFFPVDELDTFDAIDSRLQGHPCMKTLPGIDMSTGSLGQGLSPGIGMALGARLSKLDFHTWVILGDGEIQEGQIWEACFTASRYELGNLTALLDYNRLPQFGWPAVGGYTREHPIDNPAAKFAAFGWDTIECDGHDHQSLSAAFDHAERAIDRPVAIIAHTTKGKGVSFMEANHQWHAKVPSAQELENAIAEISAHRLVGAGLS